MKATTKEFSPTPRQQSHTNTTQSTHNPNEPKYACLKRGNSMDRYRDRNINIPLPDNDQNNLKSLITQSPKETPFRPSTSKGYPTMQSNMNSPRPNCEKVEYSVSPKKMTSIIKILPSKQKSKENLKTLVLDLDETLVHSGFRPFLIPSDIILKIELDGKIHDIHVLVRPGVEEFLEKMSRHFEIIIFTASLAKYADPLVDRLDIKKHCSYRLFREHCTIINNAFVKDLKKLGRDLKDLIILDNSPISYVLNSENGFPIKSWYDDMSDRELYNICNILEFLAYVPDVRDFIKKILDKNEFSYTKAIQLINSYNQSQNSASHIRATTPMISSSSKSTDYTEKERNNRYYYSNIVGKPDSNGEFVKEANNYCKDRQREIENKQINIKIITNNFTNFIINPQEGKGNENESKPPKTTNANLNANANTFRTANTPIQIAILNPCSEGGIITRSPAYRRETVKSAFYGTNPVNTNINVNAKNLNINITGIEVKTTPVLKTPLGAFPLMQSHPTPAKYSSILEQNGDMNILRTARPSTAVVIKTRHTREQSFGAVKNDTMLPEAVCSRFARSPSQHSIVNPLNRSNSKQSIHNLGYQYHDYLSRISELEGIKSITSSLKSGLSTARINKNSEKTYNRMHFNTNNSQVYFKNLRSPGNHSEYECLTPRRGYSQTSRAGDYKSVYKYRDITDINHSVASGSSNQFSATGIYRSSNVQGKSK